MNYAVIDNGIVENIIVADEGFTIDGKTLVPADGAAIGDTWDGSMFIKPPAPPEVFPDLTMRQFRLALIAAGLDEAVEAALVAMPGTAGKMARAEYEYASTVVRDNSLVSGLSGSLGLTEEQINTMWRSAVLL